MSVNIIIRGNHRMAFRFGGVAENTKAKDLVKKDDEIDYIIDDMYSGNGSYYIFLLDNLPKTDQKVQLLKKIREFTNNYTVCVAVNAKYDKNDMHGTGLTDFMLSHRSDWKKFLDRNPTAVMAFGAAMYSINGSTDILVSDFYDDVMGRSYYYIGHEYLKYDCYIFPVDGLDDLYPQMEDASYGNINWKTRFCYAQIERMTKTTDWWQPDLKEPVYHIIENEHDATALLLGNMNAELVSFDTETNGFKFYENKIHCLTISWNGVDGYYIPWEYVNMRVFQANLVSCKHRTGANPKFDIKFFWQEGLSQNVTVTDAVDRLAHVINSERKSGLKPLSYIYTMLGGYDLKLDKWKKETGCVDYSKIPTQILAPYATIDAISTWRVQQELWNQVDWIDAHYPNEKFPDWTMRRWYETQLMEIYRDVIKAEYRGIYVNYELMAKYREEMQNDIADKESQLRSLWKLDNSFNLYSTTEIGKLFEKLGFPEHGRNKAGLYITDDNAMGAWIRENQPGVKVLSDLRTEKTSLNSFIGGASAEDSDDDEDIKGWEQFIYHHPEDGSYRVQQSYLVMGTETFRFIGKDPNFQNIPSHSTYASYVKKCIDAPFDNLYILTSDSGKEYRLAAFDLVLTQDWYKRADAIKESDSIIEDSEQPTIKDYSITKQADGSFKIPNAIMFEE